MHLSITVGCILFLASLAESSPQLGKGLTQTQTVQTAQTAPDTRPLHPLETILGTKTNFLSGFATAATSQLLTCPTNTLTTASIAVWQSFGYPSRTRGPTHCCLTIVPRADTCFIRIRFEDTHLMAPVIDSCQGNTLSITGQAQGIANNVFCGALNNYETFVRPVPNGPQYSFKGRPPIRLDLNIRDALYNFKIQIQQIPCSRLGGVRPPGFTQIDAFGNGRSIPAENRNIEESFGTHNILDKISTNTKSELAKTRKQPNTSKPPKKNRYIPSKTPIVNRKNSKITESVKDISKKPSKHRSRSNHIHGFGNENLTTSTAAIGIESALSFLDGALDVPSHKDTELSVAGSVLQSILTRYEDTFPELQQRVNRELTASRRNSRTGRKLEEMDVLTNIAAMTMLCEDFTSEIKIKNEKPRVAELNNMKEPTQRITDQGSSEEPGTDASYTGYVLTRSEGGYTRLCSATLIDEDYALTSCSCVMRAGYDNGMYDVRVVFTGDGELNGQHNAWSSLYNEEDGNHAVDRVAFHPLCLHNGYQYDIAVLHLATPETEATPITLAGCDQSYDALQVTELGHGFDERENFYDVTQFRDVQSEDGDTISNTDCNNAYRSVLTSAAAVSNPVIGDELFCVELDDNDQICEGDQGGPVTQQGEDTLVGIIVGNANMCLRDERGPSYSIGQFPDVALRISCVLDFIDAATTDPDRFETILTPQDTISIPKPFLNLFG